MVRSDRQRVELLLVPILVLDVVLNGTVDPEAEGAQTTRLLLREAVDEIVQDLPERHRVKVLRRSRKVFEEVVSPYRKAGMSVAKVGLLAFYFLQNLVSQGYLVLPDEAPLQRALERFLPALEHSASITALDASAQKQAVHFLRRLQALGYFQGVISHDGESLDA